jgi:BlaI family penicillinase repressor
MKKKQPSSLELQVLSVLWRNGPSPVREVLEAMPDGKQRAYTTILTVMQGLERKGLVTHKPKGKVHIYSAKITEQKALAPVLKDLVRNVFGGSVSSVMQHLIGEAEIGSDELREIRELLDQRESAKSTETPKGAKK